MALIQSTMPHLAALSGMLLEHGFFMLPSTTKSSTAVDPEEFVAEHATRLATMRRWCEGHALQPRGSAHIAAEKCCNQLLDLKAVDCERFTSPDEGPSAIRAAVPEQFRCFFGVNVSKASIQDLACQIIPRFCCPEECVLIALVFLARLVHHRKIPFTNRSAHRMLLGCLLVAVKSHLDSTHRLKHYAAFTNCQPPQLLELESAVLNGLEWNAYVQPHEAILMAYCLRSCHTQMRSTMLKHGVTWETVVRHMQLPEVPLPEFELMSEERLSVVEHCRRRRRGEEPSSSGNSVAGSLSPSFASVSPSVSSSFASPRMKDAKKKGLLHSTTSSNDLSLSTFGTTVDEVDSA